MIGPKASINDLAVACAHSADAAEWEELLDRCVPMATMVVIRVARMWLGTASPTIVDDIVQEVFLKLCEQERRVLREFRPQGEDSFLALMRFVAASVANDHFRREYSEKRGGKSLRFVLDEESTFTNPASAAEVANIQRSVLLAELDRRLQSAPGTTAQRDRAIFWLYYLQGLTAEEISGLPQLNLTAKGVESALHRVTLWLRNEIKEPKAERQVPSVSSAQ